MLEAIYYYPKKLTKSDIDEVFNIYDYSFPSNERMDFSQIIESFYKSERVISLIKLENRIIGFAILKLLKSVDIIYLEYFAIANDFRGKQIGSKFIQDLKIRYKKYKKFNGIIFEVESPKEGAESDKIIKKKRIAFYIKNGGYILENAISYRMPDFSREGSIPMVLMWIPLTNSKLALTNDEIKQIVISIYREVYNRKRDDSLLLEIIKTL